MCEVNNIRKGGLIKEILLFPQQNRHIFYDLLENHGENYCLLTKEPRICNVSLEKCRRRERVILFQLEFEYLNPRGKKICSSPAQRPVVLIEASDPLVEVDWKELNHIGEYYIACYFKDHLKLSKELKNKIFWKYEQIHIMGNIKNDVDRYL